MLRKPGRVQDDPDIVGNVRLHRHRSSLLGPFTADRDVRHLTPESGGAGILLLKRDLPGAGVAAQHLERGDAADVLSSHASHDEESRHEASTFAEASNESESHWTGRVTKEVGTSIGIGEEDGVSIIVVEATGRVGASETELREIVDVELDQVLDNRPRMVRHQLQIDRIGTGMHDGHPMKCPVATYAGRTVG